MLNRLEYIKLNNPLLTELDDEKILNLYHRQYYSDMDYNTFKQKTTAPLEDYNKFILQSIKPREELRKVEGYNDGYAELIKKYPKEQIDNWQSKGAMNTWETWKNLKLLNCIPVAGATAEGFKNQKLLNIKEKIKYGTATEEEVNYFNISMEKLAELQVRGTNVGGKIVNGVCGSVAFMGEMALTSTGYGALPAASSEIYKNYQTRKLNDNIAITDKGEVFFTEYNKLPAITLLKSLEDVLVSYSVEKFGGKLLDKGFNKLLSTTLLKDMGANKIAKIMNKPLSWVNRNATKLLGKAGFNGVLEEYGEERLEDVIRTALNLDDKGYNIEAFKDALFPTIEDNLAELGVITILGAGGATISTTSQKLYDKLKSKNINPNDAINVIANTPELEKEKMLNKLNKIDEEQDNKTFNQRLNDFKQKLTKANVDEKEAENLTTLHSNIITNYANDLGISKTEIFDTIELEIEKENLKNTLTTPEQMVDYINNFLTDEYKKHLKNNNKSQITKEELLDDLKHYKTLQKEINKTKGNTSLIQFLSKHGGIYDEGGDIGQDIRSQAPFLLRKELNNKNNLDDQFKSAVEAGYFPEIEDYRDVDGVNTLIEAIRDELAGNERYPYGENKKLEKQEELSQLEEDLYTRGIDIKDIEYLEQMENSTPTYPPYEGGQSTKLTGGLDIYNQSINTDLELNKEVKILDISNTIKGKITKETIKQKIQELIDKKEPIKTLSEPYVMELLNKKKNHIIHSSKEFKNFTELKQHNNQLLNIDNLIKNSILIEMVDNIKKDKKPDIDKYLYFYTPIKDNNNIYIVKLFTEQGKNNKENAVNLYDVLSVKELSTKRSENKTPVMSTQGGRVIDNSSVITIKQILQNVKDFNGNNALTSYFLENNNLSQNTPNNSHLKKGQISLTDTKAIITLFQETSDASTIIHEMGHYYMKLMEIMARKNPKAKEYLNKANNFIDKEIKRSNYQTQEDYEIARQEYFARSFEAYLRRGVAPSKELKNIFERFREWLVEVYNSVKELNVKLTPEVIDFFDNFIVNNKLLDNIDSSFQEYQQLQEEIYNEREALVLNQDLTPEEIDKAIDDKYSERLNKIYDEINNGEKQTLDDTFYNNLINYSKKNKENNKFSRYFKSFGKYVKDCIRDSIANADEVIASIDPSLANKLKRFQTDIILTTDENKKKALPFFKTLEYIRKTNENDYLILDMALKNRDINKIQELTNKYNFYNEYINIRELLDNLREQAISVGIDVGYLNNYFPRQVDPKRKNEFISFLRANETGTYNDLLYNLEQLRNNKLFTQEDELKFINNFLRGFIPKDLILLTPNGNLKNPRSIEIITPEMAEYFLPSNIALQNYIEATTKDVITREAFGIEDRETRDLRNKLKEKHRQLKRVEETPAGKFKTNQEYKLTVNKAVKEKNLERLSHKANPTIEEQEQLKNIQNEIESIETQIDNLQKTNAFAVKNNHIKQIKQEIEEIKDKLPSDKLEDSIANFINSIENLDLEQNNILKKYISSIVNPAPSTTLTKIINNTAYGLALTSFKNALNQLPELAVSFYKNGFFNTVESIITRHKINMEDLGLEDMVGEINKKGLDFINKVLTLTGFNKIDMFGKNTFLNSNLIKTKKELINNNEDTNRDIEQLMTKDAEKVKEDILNDRMSFEVKEYLLMKLAGVQPILVSSRPYYYLNSGNARMFYTLKIFSIKQLNMLHNDIIKKITSGDIKETITGLQNLIKYQAFLFMVGAPIDIIMGLATGYDDEDENLITNAMIDNILIFNIMSRYTLSKAGKQGIGSATVDYLFTPVSFRFADDIQKDIKKLLIGELEFENWRTLKYLPFGKDLRTLKEVVDE